MSYTIAVVNNIIGKAKKKKLAITTGLFGFGKKHVCKVYSSYIIAWLFFIITPCAHAQQGVK